MEPKKLDGSTWKMPEGLKSPLQKVAELCKQTPGLWDTIVALRGPDTPSERECIEEPRRSSLYHARVDRKMRTAAVIRGLAVGQQAAAKTRTDIAYIVLPPQDEWDHFDRHMVKAANALNLEIKIDPSLSIKSGEKAVMVEKLSPFPLPTPKHTPTALHVNSGIPAAFPPYAPNCQGLATKWTLNYLYSHTVSTKSALAACLAEHPEWFIQEGMIMPPPPPKTEAAAGFPYYAPGAALGEDPPKVTKGLITLKKAGLKVKTEYVAQFNALQAKLFNPPSTGLVTATKQIITTHPSWFTGADSDEAWPSTLAAPATPSLSTWKWGQPGYLLLKAAYKDMVTMGEWIVFKKQIHSLAQSHPELPWDEALAAGSWTDFQIKYGSFSLNSPPPTGMEEPGF